MYTVDDIPDGSDALYGASVACGYYGGMMSALYALSSGGHLELYKGEGLGRIIRELHQAVHAAEAHYPDDVDALRSFLAWCEQNDSE
jgi:hypothetical protein